MLEQVLKQQYKQINTFEDLKLDANLLGGLADFGIKRPTQLQKKAIPLMQSKSDCVIISPTRTDKLTTIAIGVLAIIDQNDALFQALILAPTQSEAQRMYYQILKLSQHMGITVRMGFGNTIIEQHQLAIMQENVQIFISTPEIAAYIMGNDQLFVQSVKSFILTDGEQIIKRHFEQAIYYILGKVNDRTAFTIFTQQVLEDIDELIKTTMNHPNVLQISRQEFYDRHIEHVYIQTQNEDHKINLLMNNFEIDSCFIYVNNETKAQKLIAKLRQNNYQVQRSTKANKLIESYVGTRFYKILPKSILICIDQIDPYAQYRLISPEMIINYDMPSNPRAYQARTNIGEFEHQKRTILNFVSASDKDLISNLMHNYKVNMELLPLQ